MIFQQENPRLTWTDKFIVWVQWVTETARQSDGLKVAYSCQQRICATKAESHILAWLTLKSPEFCFKGHCNAGKQNKNIQSDSLGG